MAIDIRATVTCSLGTLISGSISDDYLQGSGLIKTRGSCEISGLITPATGSVVTFTYTKAGVTRTIPHKMRVLSSFADPFRRTTKVELGCKLTYLSDLKERIDWSAFDDPENEDYDEEDRRVIPLPIYASTAMRVCLAKLSLVASSIPLTNRFLIDKFDYSAGYVNVLSDLLISESYFGYLDQNEVLQVVSLDQAGGTGPVFTKNDIIDLGPIGVGQLPGEAVVVSYSTQKLRSSEVPEEEQEPIEPEEIEEEERINWEKTVTTNSPQDYYINYVLETDPEEELRTEHYVGADSSESFTQYKEIQVQRFSQQEKEEAYADAAYLGSSLTLVPFEDLGSFNAAFAINPSSALSTYIPNAETYDYVLAPVGKWINTGGGWDKMIESINNSENYETMEVVDYRETFNYGPSISVLSSIAAERLRYRKDFGNTTILLQRTYETFRYDEKGNQIGTTTEIYESAAALAAGAPVRWAGTENVVLIPAGTRLAERIVTENTVIDDYTQDVVTTYIQYSKTQCGQQAISKAAETAKTLPDMETIINDLVNSGLVRNNTQVTTSRKGVTLSQQRPPFAVRMKAKYDPDATTDDPNTGDSASDAPSLESKAELALALGSPTAERRIEFSMPYAPDDYFYGTSGGPFYQASSDARQKAMLFGRVQNRLLLGNRSGVNLQVAPERMPGAPFQPLYLKADGLTALYRTNANQWAFDSNGIVCSTDALFWAAVSGTGTFWFPVAPGVTTLPAEPPIVDGEMNANTVVLPYNEIARYDGRVRLRNIVTKFDYALTLLTTVPSLRVRTTSAVERYQLLAVPASSITIAAYAPVAVGSTDLRLPTPPDIAVAAPVPRTGATIVRVPAATITVQAPVPTLS